MTLALYDVRGGLVTHLLERSWRTAGWNEIRWHPDDLAAGVYFWRLESAAGSQRTAKWMISR